MSTTSPFGQVLVVTGVVNGTAVVPENVSGSKVVRTCPSAVGNTAISVGCIKTAPAINTNTSKIAIATPPVTAGPAPNALLKAMLLPQASDSFP